MSDFNELNHEPKIRVQRTITKAWELVGGLKGSAWGGLAFLMLVAVGVTIAAGLILLIISLSFFGGGVDPNSLSQGQTTLIQALNMAFSIVSDFFIIPIAIGLALIPVHRLKGEVFTAYRVFDYFKWRYMWRFFVVLIVNYVIIFAVAFVLVLILIPMAAMHGGEPTITPTLIITASLFGLIFFLILAYVGSALHFSNMLIAEKEMSLAHALGNGFKGVTRHFFGMLGALFLAALIFIGFEAICVGIGFLFAYFHLTALGIFLAICFFIFGIVWLLPFALNVWALLYSQIFGIETAVRENYENVVPDSNDQI